MFSKATFIQWNGIIFILRFFVTVVVTLETSAAANKKNQQNKANLKDLIAATVLVFFLNIGFKSLFFEPIWPGNLMEDIKKIIGHLLYTMSSIVHNFKAIGEF